MICECSAAAIVESMVCQHAPSNSSWNTCWSAGDLTSMTCSMALTHMSLTRVVRCRARSMGTAGRDNCSVAMALGTAQQHEHNTHADKHKHVRELEHESSAAYSPKLSPTSTMGTTPHAAHMVVSAVCSAKSSTAAVTSGATRRACAKHMLTAVVKAGEKGQATLAREAECEGAWRAGISNGEGGVAQLSR